MPAKKSKDPKSAKEPQPNSKGWEPGLLAAQIEEDQWKPAIYFTVGETLENELFLAALSAAISVPLRKLFSIISWEGTMKQIVEFGNPKSKKPSDLPMFYEITEVAWALLAKGEQLSLPLLSKVVKFQLLCIKQKDLQRKENKNKATEEEEATMSGSASKKKSDKKSAGKGKGKTEKKSPEPPLIKKSTKLLKRGEEEVIDKCINDEPDDGPQRYIIIQGFQNLQFLLMLGELGINISAVIKISYEKNESFLKQDPAEPEMDLPQPPEAIEAERLQKEEANKSLKNFWKYLEPVLNSGKPGSKLFDIARLQYTVKEAILPQDWNNDDMKLEFGAAIFEDIASMIYDCEDWKRQHRNYLSNLKLITVPEASKGEEMLALQTPTGRKKSPSAESTSPEQDTSTVQVDMRYYNDLMSLVPLESLSVPLILHCILEQVVATEESLTPPSELVPKPREDGLDHSLVDYMISTVLSLSMPEDEKQKMIEEFKEPPQKTMNEISKQLSFHDAMREQVAVTEEDKPLPSEEGPGLQEYRQKPVLEEEQQKMIEELEKSVQKRPCEELKQPLLLNFHDTLTWRTHHLKVLQGFDSAKAEQEMMKKLPIAEFLNFTHPSPEDDDKRLASIQELMYHCTNEKVTSSEVERAFKQFVFESLKFTKVEENGELEEKESMLAERLESAYIPWDDPVRFAKEMKRIVNVKKTHKQNNCVCAADLFTRISESTETCPLRFSSSSSRKSSMSCVEPPCSVHFEDTSEMADEKNRKDSLTDAENKKDKADNLKIDIKAIQNLQLRSLMEWWFAEQHDPFVLIQVLQEAVQFYRCVDTYYYRQDNSTLLVLHNPMNKQRQCKQSWEAALHSDAGFRNYLEYVAKSVSDWVEEEEAKYRAKLAAKELEDLKSLQPSSEVSPESRSSSSERPKKGKAGSANKSLANISRLPTKTEIEEEEEKSNEPFMREGSLKAWKKDQEKLKEEEQKKEKKGKKDKPDSKKKKEGVQLSEAKESKLSKKSAKQGSKGIKEEQETISEAQELPEPIEKVYKFTGYNFGNDLIQVSGEVKSLFPADGGHIQVKIIHFLHGSTFIQVCVMRDRHLFFIYITDPIKNLDESKEVPTEKAGSENSKKEEEMTKKTISKFGSFSAILDDGIIITLSKHAPTKEQKKDEEDPVLADILNIPTVQAPTPVPLTTPPPTGKQDKSSKNKGPPSAKGKQKKESVPPLPVEEPEQPKEEPKVEIEESEPAAPSEYVPEPPVFMCLNACSPDGLLITYFTEDSIGIKNEDTSEERILLRQSYPIKTKGSQPCEAARKWPAMQEASRVITLQGTVVKYMMDGSTEILFADGTVSKSPDSGPVPIPQPSTVASSQPDPDPQELKDENELKRDPSEEESKKGKHGHRNNSALNPSEPPAMQTQPSEAPPEPEPGTWITTTPTGLAIGTKGMEKLDLKPILVYTATDPGTGEVMITRQDKVVTVFGNDNTIVEHADGTRITTIFQDITIPYCEVQYETEEIPHKVIRHVKCIKVECVGFATVLMNWEDCACWAVFGNGTTIIAKPQGMYQVFPASVGCLLIDQDGCAVYTSGTNRDVMTPPTISHMELQPGAYFMKYTSPVICEVMDPEENYFQVLMDGNTFAVTHNDSPKGEKEDALLQGHMVEHEPITYNKHAPRFFILHADGSGTELLRSNDVEEYLYRAYSSPATAVLKEQLPEFPGVLGITFLQPSTEDIGSRWLIKKEVANIIPPNLQSRKWDTFPQVECKTPGPPFGTHLSDLHSQQADCSSPTVLKCPSVLEVHQLFQYEPINTEMRQKMQSCLKEYIELILQKEQELNEMILKEPRDEEELVHAADLLKLVLSLPDDEECQTEEKETSKVDVASIYEHAVAPTFKNPPETATCEWTKVDLKSNNGQNQISRWPQRVEQYRQELDEVKASKLALKNMIVPSYFHSDLGKAFNSAQRLDTDYLPKSFPISETMKVPCSEAVNGLASAAPDSDTNVCNRPTYPTPAHATETGTCSLKRSDSPTQQAVIAQCQYSTPDVSNRPTYPTPVHAIETGTCSFKRSDSPTQQAVISQRQYSTPACSSDACNRLLNPTSTHATEAKTCCPMRSDVQVPQTMTPQCQHSTSTNPILQRAEKQDLTSQKPNNCCSLHKPLSIPVDVLKDIGTINGIVEYRPEELPADGSNFIFNKSLIIDAASHPRKEKVKLPSAILGSKPGSLPNQRFAVIEEPVRRKVNTVSIAGPIAGGILKEPTRGFELFPREVNFGVLQEGFTYTYTVLLKNVGIDSCRFRVKQPPPSTGLRVCFKPGPVPAGLKTELEIELYAMAIGLESTEGAGYLCHHLEILTEAEELFLPIIATVLTENVYKNRPEEFPEGGKAAGVRLLCTDPTSRMDIIRPRKPPAEDPVGTYILCET